MADAAHEWTDAQLAELEGRYRRQYEQAAREMRGKQEAHLAKFEREREAREKAMDDTPEAREAHRAWLRGQAARQEWLQGMASELSGAANQANRRASDALNDAIPRVYAENANRAAFEIDRAVRSDTGYTMVDQDTVRHLMGLPTDEERLVHEVIPCGPALPSWESLRHDVDIARDIAWNRQRFAAAITQGILQGESIPDIVRRTNDVFGSNLAAAVRAARTACTEAENAGRVNSYARAERLGIELEQEWMATLDERTRESHRNADGQRRKVGEPFDVGGSKLRYPGDPTGAQDQVWNCRCTLVAAVQGAAEQARERWARLPEGTTYDEWRRGRPTTRDASYANPAGILPASWGPAPAPISGRPSAPEPAPATAPVTDRDAQVWADGGDEAYRVGTALLEGADAATRDVWGKYEGELRLVDTRARSGFFRPIDGVHMNLRTDLDNKRGTGRMATWFHEFGHNIDYISAPGSLSWLSHNMGLGDAVREEIGGIVDARLAVIKAEHKAALKALAAGDFEPAIIYLEERTDIRYLSDRARQMADHLGDSAWYAGNGYPPLVAATRDAQEKYLADMLTRELKGNAKPLRRRAYADLEREIRALTVAEKHSLSDMAEGATKGGVQAGWGHGKGYWKDPENLSLEAFAEFFSAECVYSETPQTLDTLKRYLPKSYERYREILEEAGKRR